MTYLRVEDHPAYWPTYQAVLTAALSSCGAYRHSLGGLHAIGELEDACLTHAAETAARVVCDFQNDDLEIVDR